MTTSVRPTRPPAAARRRSTLDRATAARLAATEYQRFADLLAGLTPAQWATPTRCPGWDVRAMAGHALGMAEMAASLRESRRQTRQALARLRAGRAATELDALTGLQVDEHAGLSAAAVAERYRVVGPKAARARARTPGFIGRRRLPMSDPFPGDTQWSIGFLVETILTRDPWLHRVDVADATATPMTLTPEHDGVVVADVVAEWAGRHGQPCTVALGGPAGGRWTFGGGGPAIELDALEFCRRVSGRGPAEGLLTTQVPF